MEQGIESAYSRLILYFLFFCLILFLHLVQMKTELGLFVVFWCLPLARDLFLQVKIWEEMVGWNH